MWAKNFLNLKITDGAGVLCMYGYEWMGTMWMLVMFCMYRWMSLGYKCECRYDSNKFKANEWICLFILPSKKNHKCTHEYKTAQPVAEKTEGDTKTIHNFFLTDL